MFVTMVSVSQQAISFTTPARSAPERRILLIEDNKADALLAKMAHDELKQCSWMDAVHDGDQAIRYLHGEGEFSNRTKPDVILLDLTLPARSGLEMIAAIKAVPGCELIPIVIISGTENPITLRQAYELGANCVIKKTIKWDEYYEKLETCYKFWCTVVELPPAATSRESLDSL